ncbi:MULTISPECIES: ferrochelatase [Halorussus]|uniref:ferrochelatase n=1 Tax=Halorussus TaxID=1070314 RepID=UPI000E21A71B|nr:MULTISPECIES: ferrochelatase [Halorussus]NHN61545.1 ferrochelatase [Halorussus sp. JP-T4]
MTTGVVLLNFGEPAEPTRENVVAYLERIFLNNASLEEADTEEEARERARQLAERRVPGLMEEYEEIGGSPLNPQAEAQADALAAELGDRGYDVETYVGMQFTEPFVGDAVEAARADGVDELVGLPVYPLCGASTTVAALDELKEAAAERDWDVSIAEITGWHRHPQYNALRADNVRRFAAAHDVDLTDEATELVYSAHGTPQHYLDEGSRYDLYVEEFCEVLGRKLGIDSYSLGYQNHENRDIPWTEPDVEEVIEELGDDDSVERVVVEPVSFMHEQSETLSELDDELREEAEDEGLEFYRVPVPHDDDRFKGVLADLAEPFVGDFDPGYYQYRQCQCSDSPNAMCLNAPVERT